MNRITVVIEYDHPDEIPAFSVKSTARIDGGPRGKVVVVAFEDALSEKEGGKS